jgi:hypothetical protein
MAVRVKDGAFSPTWNNPAAETVVAHSSGKTNSPNVTASRLITTSISQARMASQALDHDFNRQGTTVAAA